MIEPGRQAGRVVDREVDHRLAVFLLLHAATWFAYVWPCSVESSIGGPTKSSRSGFVACPRRACGLSSPSGLSPSPSVVAPRRRRLAGRPLARRALDAQELVDRVLDRLVGRGHVAVVRRRARPGSGPRAPAPTGRARNVFSSSSSVDRVADVRGRVLGEDVEQLVAVVDQLLGRQLLARLAQEVLLARRAHEVVVEVAEADVLERVVAAQPLVAGLDVDLRGPRLGRDVVAAVDVDVDAADRVDGVGEAGEVDVDDVVDRRAR